MTTLRVAVVGLGNRARAHAPLIRVMRDKFELVAVCDAVTERARAAGAEYGVPWYDNVERMLAQERLDIVDIVLPPDAHHVVAVLAAEHKVHLMCETPISITLPLIDAMLDAVRRNGVKLEVAEQVYRWPEERLKRKIVEAGVIGTPLRVYCRFRTGAYHAMNALRAYTGWARPLRVWGANRSFTVTPFLNFGNPSDREDWEHALVEFEGGVIGVHEQVSNWLSPFRRDLPRNLGIDGSKGFIVENDVYLFADGANHRYPIQTETVDVEGVAVPARYKVETDPPVVWENPYTRYPVGDTDGIARIDYWHSLYQAIVNDTEPTYGPLQARLDQELPIAYRESARCGGTPVELPLTQMTGYEERLHQEYKQMYGSDPLADLGTLAARAFPQIGIRWAVR
jgi:predicted dehydrogenase